MSGQRDFYQLEHRRQQVTGYFYLSGKRIRRRLCSFEQAGLDETGEPIDKSARGAKKRAAVLDALHREAERNLLDGQAVKHVESQSIKVLFQEWINWGRTNRAPKTVEVYLAAANKYMKVVGDHPVGKVTLRHIDKLTAALVENGNSPATVNMTLRTVKSFLRWCADRDEMEKVPKIKMLPEAKRFPKVLSENDLGKVFDRITGLIKKEKGRIKKRALVHHHRFLTVAIHTGMRRSEIVFLPWSGVDFEDGVIRVLVHARFKVKERREKVVPMHRDLATYLLGQREAAPEEVWLLDDGTGQLGYKRPESMTKAFNRHFRALGLSELGVKATHGNRALMAGRMREAGADLAVIQATLGHSSIQMTQSYFPDDDDLKRKAIKNLPSFGAKLAQLEV